MTHLTSGFRASGLIIGMVAFLASPVVAQEDQGRFDLILKGIKAGSLAFSGVQDGSSYAVTGQLKTTGIASLLRKIRYDASSNGTVQGGTYVPETYSENADTGKRQSQAVMAYKAGVPQLKSYNPPRAPKSFDVDPATMGGTVDPLTALYATLRNVEAGSECQVNVQMFDGRRQSQITTGERQTAGEQVVCQGEYRRLAGFSAEDLAEKTRFRFSLIYSPSADGMMRVTEVSMDTLYGKAKLVRQ
jgi:hypothetical protein